jgi:hypothetical protein
MTWLKRILLLVVAAAAAVALYCVTVVALAMMGVIPIEMCTARDTSDQVPQCHSTR